MSAPVVAQADRDAAQALCASGWTHAIEAFARHRTAAEAASAATVAELVHTATDLLQHIDWLTKGLPDLLENAGLTDEDGLIGAAVDAANSARAILARAKATEQVQPLPGTVAEKVTVALAALVAGKATVEHLSESAWASITFSGARHEFHVFPDDRAKIDELTTAIADWQPTIAGHLVADAHVKPAVGGMRVTILLVDELQP